MIAMLQLSLVLNIAVLVPVTIALATGRRAAREVFGEPSPARGILLSVYFSILVVSAALLVLQDARSSAVLLLMQVVYKLATPFTVGSLTNPVVLSNLAISVVHIVSLVAFGLTVIP